MSKKLFLLALVATLGTSVTASAYTIRGYGGKHFLQAIAKQSARNFVHQRCHQDQGRVIPDSTIVHDCREVIDSPVHADWVCEASCGCAN